MNNPPNTRSSDLAHVDQAFRFVFAEAHERLTVVLLPVGPSQSRTPNLKPLLVRGNPRDRMRCVFFGSPSYMKKLSENWGPEGTQFGYHFLEEWADPILPQLLSVSDRIVILPGAEPRFHTLEKLLKDATVVVLPHGTQVVGESSPLQMRTYDPNDEASLTRALVDYSADEHPVQSQSLPDNRHNAPSLEPSCLGSQKIIKDPRTKPRNLVLYNNWGIGDELLLSAVAREITRSYPAVNVWIRSRHGFPFPSYVRRGPPPQDAVPVETIYQNASLYGPPHHSPYPGHLVQQMLDKVFLDTGWLVQAKDVRPELASSPRSRSNRVPESVILHSRPNPRLPSKDWGLERWEATAHLLNDAGIMLRQVGAAGEPLLPHAEDLRGVPMAALHDLVVDSGAVLCLVGFLMHVAAAARIPAIVIYGGREHPAIDGYPDQVHLSSGPLHCRGRWGCHLAADHPCPHSMRCMVEITPEIVSQEVLNVLYKQRTGVPV